MPLIGSSGILSLTVRRTPTPSSAHEPLQVEEPMGRPPIAGDQVHWRALRRRGSPLRRSSSQRTKPTGGHCDSAGGGGTTQSDSSQRTKPTGGHCDRLSGSSVSSHLCLSVLSPLAGIATKEELKSLSVLSPLAGIATNKP